MSLNLKLHKFVNGIVMHLDEPVMWPLSTEDQIRFIRETIWAAKIIRDTKEYQEEELKFKIDEYSQ